MTKGTIVLVPFPFADLSTMKVRPALCLTDETGPFKQVVLAFISSNLSGDKLSTDIVLDDNSPWFEATKLRVSSILKVNKLVTVEKKIIKTKLGILPDKILKEVDEKLNELFKLNINNSDES